MSPVVIDLDSHRPSVRAVAHESGLASVTVGGESGEVEFLGTQGALWNLELDLRNALGRLPGPTPPEPVDVAASEPDYPLGPASE